jgi:uncharacterized protein (TIGR03382 family)
MNMKRGLVFTLCSLAVAAMASSAMAQANVQLSLNLRYTDPADPSEGGQWYLVAKTDDPDGISAISAYISNITPTAASMTYGNGSGPGATAYGAANSTTAATLGAITNGGNPFAATIGGAVNVVYGQDLTTTIVADVGQGAGTPGNVASDPLKNANWNNAAVIATGTWTGSARPAFVSAGANSTDSNTLGGTTLGSPAFDANTTTTVRGDSLFSLGLNTPGTAGLRAGDANRDFAVTGADFAILQNNFNQAPGTKGWDQGDFNDDGNVSGADFALLQNNFGQPATAPQVAAVPEPGTISLAIAAAGLAVAFSRRRS